ncbi:hypothetical protein [Hymenobacter koreensis]|uniref:Uncharacterized protein n=1 Tax=Hymenobacter koreensis TaxID=1084523 RepID=A0ABP8JJW8_9BACT
MPEPLFHIGQEIVCTNDNFAIMHVLNHPSHPSHPQFTTPRKGPVYHVRGFVTTPAAVGVLLDEIVNPPMAKGVPEANFNQNRFAAVPPIESISLSEVLEESLAEAE